MYFSQRPLSIVIPVHNNAFGLPLLMSALQECIQANQLIHEIILVNDASTDNSREIIDSYQTTCFFPVKPIHITTNIGQHAATLVGIKLASGEFILTIDDDLQFLPNDINLLFLEQKATNADLIYGSPHNRNHSLPRNVASRVALFLFHHILGVSKNASSFRLIKRTLTEQIKTTQNKLVFIDGLLAKFDPKTTHVFVQHQLRPVGKSGHNLVTQGWWTLKILFHYSVRH